MTGPTGDRTVAGRYRLTEMLGRGGMGTVWRAADTVLDRDVAVKEVRVPEGLDDEERARRSARAMREVRAAALVVHPNVVVVYDVVEDDGRPWIVMEFVPGRTLAEDLDEGRLPVRDAARLTRQLIDALRSVHAADVVHRDVKPGNVLLSRDGRAVLTDFGIATLVGATTITATGTTIGTLEYMAPERAQGLRPGPPSDLWAVGATLYEMLEGRSPFRRNGEFATLQAVLDATYDPPRHAGPLAPLIAGLLTADPDARMTADEALRLLAEVEAAGPGSSPGGRAAEAGSAPGTEATWFGAGAGAGVGVGAGAAAGPGPAAGVAGTANDATSTGHPQSGADAPGERQDAVTVDGVPAPQPTRPEPGASAAFGAVSAGGPSAARAAGPARGSSAPPPMPASLPTVGVAGAGAPPPMPASAPGVGTPGDPGAVAPAPRRRVLLLSVGAVVLAGVVIAVALLLKSTGSDSGGKSSGSAGAAGNAPAALPSSAGGPSPVGGAASPTVSPVTPGGSATGRPESGASPADRATSSPSGGSGSAARAGFRRVDDPAGFSVSVPDGWSGRDPQGDRIFFRSPDSLSRLGVRIDPGDASGDPYADLSAQDAGGTGSSSTASYPGYQRVRLDSTTFRGNPAVLWEFTWSDGGTQRRSINMRYTAGGHTYDFWVSGPDGASTALRAAFDEAKSTFTTSR
ncbi:serine/threonine-protein kinase [Uniformispora flossi]|uniref:serine/threonine-protein kinase n=1 Tax=Uniformispora flossi TaxID=3390723 RepID=UPI003C2BE3BF